MEFGPVDWPSVANVPLASHLRARRLGLVALVARRLGRPVRHYGRGRGSRVDLIADAFADRWSFPQARASFAVARRLRVCSRQTAGQLVRQRPR